MISVVLPFLNDALATSGDLNLKLKESHIESIVDLTVALILEGTASSEILIEAVKALTLLRSSLLVKKFESLSNLYDDHFFGLP